ncbi:MAG: threonine aldolase family protein [Thermoplasmatota archaeon]
MSLDFRSDTITQPTQAMRDAMAAADVGDDVFGEDPTIAKLEEEAARRMGMEAALFTPTGTMANQIALWVHSGRGGQAVVEENCHMALYEGGAAALLHGVSLRTLRAPRGIFGPDDLEPHIFPDDPHFAATKIVAIENTHNWAGGTVWQPGEVRAVAEFAHDKGAALHVDGARIFNAATAAGATPDRLLGGADSVMFCLSKGLSAPVGSLLCGSSEFIEEAHFARKCLGGGMRQAGVIAAAGLVALQKMVDRLADDHANAQRLAVGLAAVPGLALAAPVETNMVMVDTSATGMAGEAFCAALEAATGVRALTRDAGPTARFVTHRHITEADVDEAVAAVAGWVKGL